MRDHHLLRGRRRRLLGAFALAMLGVDNVAVYDGSLLEWSADPSLPMTTDER